MNSQTTILIILFAFFIMIIILGVRERKSTQMKTKKMIKKMFGKKRKNPECTDNYKDYFNNTTVDHFIIDDTTASDVDLDNVFKHINHTYSVVGEEYLYYTLRTPAYDDDICNKKEEAIKYFSNEKNRDTVLLLQEKLYELGKTKKIDLFYFLNKLDESQDESSMLHYVCYLLYIISIILLIYKTGLGLVMLIGSIAFGIVTYFSKKTKLIEILAPTFYISRLEKTAKEINKILNPKETPEIINNALNSLNDSIKNIDKATKGTGYVLLSSDKNKNIAALFIDYINMVLHIDILLFYKIKKGLKAKNDDILNLIKNIGLIDSLLAISSYRCSLDEYCIPDFSGDKNSIKSIYHPLMEKAVRNDADISNNMLITGSNASGKSTYLKAVSLAIIMAETINTVCASSYQLCHYRPYTSMALSDNLKDGDSFFMAEIKSIKRVIDDIENHPVKIILFIDEILKGTNTVERIAASSQITKYLDDNKVKCIFATHDTELPKLLNNIVHNVHFKEEIIDGDVRFSYQLQEGPSKSRNAIKLLSKLGYDNTLTNNASDMAEHYENTKEWIMK